MINICQTCRNTTAHRLSLLPQPKKEKRNKRKAHLAPTCMESLNLNHVRHADLMKLLGVLCHTHTHTHPSPILEELFKLLKLRPSKLLKYLVWGHWNNMVWKCILLKNYIFTDLYVLYLKIILQPGVVCFRDSVVVLIDFLFLILFKYNLI